MKKKYKISINNGFYFRRDYIGIDTKITLRSIEKGKITEETINWLKNPLAFYFAQRLIKHL